MGACGVREKEGKRTYEPSVMGSKRARPITIPLCECRTRHPHEEVEAHTEQVAKQEVGTLGVDDMLQLSMSKVMLT